jgi:hypothetical protein
VKVTSALHQCADEKNQTDDLDGAHDARLHAAAPRTPSTVTSVEEIRLMSAAMASASSF